MSEAHLKFRDVEATDEDIGTVESLAAIIWHRHFPGMIPLEQIAYMLERMYAPHVVGREIATGACHWQFAVVNDAEVGYCSSHADGTELRIEKLYLLQEWQGQGLGQQMLAMLADEAKELGLRGMVLRVNRGNVKAILAYQRAGFRIREELRQEIGQGFVMDDLVMEKIL